MRVIIDIEYLLTGHARIDNITMDGPDAQSMNRIFVAVCLVFIPVVTVANLLVISSIFLYPGYHYCHNYFLLSQSISDLLMGVYCLPMYSLRYWNRTESLVLGNKYLCLAWFSSDVLTDSGLLHSLLLIAADRYIAVMFPLKYHTIVTPRRAVLTLLSVWNLVIVTAFIPMLGWNRYARGSVPLSRRCHLYTTLPHAYVTWVSLVSIGLVFVTSCILYSQITVIIFRQSREPRELIPRFSQREMKRLDHHLKSVKISSILTFMYIFFWLPSLSVSVVKRYKVMSATDHVTAEMVNQCLQYVNCVLNFLTYVCFQTDFPIVLKLMLTTRPCRWKVELRALHGLLHTHTYHYKAFTTSEFFSEKPMTELASECKQATAATAGTKKSPRILSSPVVRRVGSGRQRLSKIRSHGNSLISPGSSSKEEEGFSDKNGLSSAEGEMSEEVGSIEDVDETKNFKSRQEVAMFLDQIYKVAQLKPSTSSVISYMTSDMITTRTSVYDYSRPYLPGSTSPDVARKLGMSVNERRREIASDSRGTSVDDARLYSRRSSRAQRVKRLRSLSTDSQRM